MFSAKAAARAAVKEDIDATRSESPPRVPSSLPARRRVDREPRRDGLQAAFLKFHNHAVDFVRARGAADPAAAFAQARRLTTWHYQWIVTNEILPSFVGRALVDDIVVRGRRFYRVDDEAAAAVPVEFQGAAYRFGHSLVRPSYRANLRGDNGVAFFGFVFDSAAQGQSDPADLRGGARAPRRFIGWQTFFDSATAKSSRARRSTRASPRRCSTCRSARSPTARRLPRCHSAICCVT